MTVSPHIFSGVIVKRNRTLFFFFNVTATTEIYTLSLHDALPIFLRRHRRDAAGLRPRPEPFGLMPTEKDPKSTRLNSSHLVISYDVFCLQKKMRRPHPDEVEQPVIEARLMNLPLEAK